MPSSNDGLPLLVSGETSWRHDKDNGGAAKHRSSNTLSAALTALCWLLVVSQASHMIAPPSLSGAISSLAQFGLMLCMIVFVLAAFTGTSGRHQVAGLISVLYLMHFSFSSSISETFQLSEAFRRFAPIFALLTFYMVPKRTNFDRIHFTAVALVWLSLLYVLNSPAYFHESEFFANAGDRQPRLWPFIEESPHSTGYYIGALAIICLVTIPAKSRQPYTWFVALTFCISIYILLGLRSSQAILTFLAFCAGALVSDHRVALVWRTATVVLGIMLSAYVVARQILYNIDLMGYVDIYRMGSGRIGTWLGRIDDFSHRSLLEMLIGSGPGSDVYRGAMWTYEATAHNTFITYLIEYGLVGFVFLLVTIAYLPRLFGKIIIPVLVATIASSLIGNGLLMRPLPMLLYLFAGYLWYAKFMRGRMPEVAEPKK
ncbi:putative membrane protein (plasmid) [Agrobacterium sp. RAC06]|nr:putative membrane protein [Agrobacterium sp. RAC06]